MKHIIITLIILLFAVPAHASLIDNFDGTVTQTRNDSSVRMWLQDANYAQTSGYDADGLMTWPEAMTWIDNLNSTNHLNYSNWRLPYVLPLNGSTYQFPWTTVGATDHGSNISAPGTLYAGSTASEMAYLYYVELENTNGNLVNTGPFINIQTTRSPNLYWSNNEIGIGSGHAWDFRFDIGDQGTSTHPDFAWAVRDAAPIPEPSTMLLLGSGLFGLGAFRKKFKR